MGLRPPDFLHVWPSLWSGADHLEIDIYTDLLTILRHYSVAYGLTPRRSSPRRINRSSDWLSHGPLRHRLMILVRTVIWLHLLKVVYPAFTRVLL